MIIRTLHLFFSIVFIFGSCFAQNENQCGAPYAGTGNMHYSGHNYGCVPLTMTVSNGGANSENESYVYEYTNGFPDFSDRKKEHTYTYTKPGVYTIMQISYDISNGRELRACTVVSVRDTIQPPFEVTVCSNQNVVLTILPVNIKPPNIYYDKFIIDWGDGSATAEVYSVNSSLSHTYKDNLPKKVSVRGTFDYGDCGGTLRKTITFSDSPPKPIIKKVLSLDASTTELEIENTTGMTFKVLKNESGLGFQASSITTQKSETIKIPTDTKKNTCFKLQSADACIADLASDIACNVLFDVQSATLSNELKWEANADKSIKILKNNIEITEANSIINSSKTNSFEDVAISCLQENCYQLIADRGTYQAISPKICLTNRLISCKNSRIPIYIPNAISPNGDGHYDDLVLTGNPSYFVQLKIFDRMGNLVGILKDFSDKWSANDNLSNQYFYWLTSKDSTGELKNTFGTIEVIK